MSKMTWFKLHSDFRNDPKIKRLPIAERYAFIILLCLANESETRGTITGLDDDDIAFELEIQSEDWQTLKAKFKIKGFIDFTKDQILIRNWDKRQYDKPSDHPEATKQRKRLQREKIKLSKGEDVTPVSRDVTPVSRTRVDQSREEESRSDQSREEKKENDFFSDSLDLNLAMQQTNKLVCIADREDPAPLPPAPLSGAAIALKAKFEAKFDRKANKYEPQGLTIAGYGEWHLGDRYNNWKPSLIAVAQKRKRDANQADTPKAATDYIYNMARDCYRELHWGKFENLISDAVEYEKALAANPTQNQEIEVVEPIVYDHHYPWQHFYPMKGKVNPKGDEAEIIWGMINSRPPDPVDERCQKFLVKANGDTERLTKLLKATHALDPDVASYEIQANDFANAIDGLIAALNQEIEKLLQAV
jgi:hypothetical protein